MKQFPITSASPVLRTDFGSEAVWEAICDEIRRPSAEGFRAHVELIDDRDFDRLARQQILAAVPNNYPHSFIVVVDREAVSDDEHALLVINLYDGLGAKIGDAFRALPCEIQGIENNLSIANMDFAEFAGAIDGRGVFRGFRGGN
jgi:hypothetical protein